MRIQDLLPEDDVVLNLEPEELAQAVLQVLVSEGGRGSLLNPYNFSLNSNLQGYANPDQVAQAVMEAWVWLEREGFIAPRPGEMNNWVFVTRRGRKAAQSQNWEAYRKADQLPRQFLHPYIASRVWSTFLRGDYDSAVFQAYKEVEVRVREAIDAPTELIGVDLMRKAFHSSNGLLSDKAAPKAERDALAHLFAGAIGSYKNPHSHRHVEIEAQEASEMIILASHLLRIIDQRVNTKNV